MIKIKKISRRHYKGKVYDINVDKDHNYVVEDCVVHNSAGGSLVAYALDITRLDPLKYNLLFERFLDAARLDEIVNKGLKLTADLLPDIDCDFSDRDAVKEYLVSKYGKNNVCSIGTVGRAKNKSVLQDLAKIYNVPYQEVLDITTNVMKTFTDKEENMSVSELKNKSRGLRQFFNQHSDIEKDFEKLRGGINNWGKHAGGVLVSDKPLTDILPVRNVDGHVVSCWTEGLSGRELGQMGFVKMDILGIDAMQHIQNVLDLINKRKGSSLTMYDLPLEDKYAFSLANNLDVVGVFQLDSDIAKKVIRDMGGIKCFSDYSACSTMIRPASLKNNFPKIFGDRREGVESYYLPDCLKPFLGDTYGLPIYQEAAYHVARHLAGFDVVAAYKFMKLLYKGKMTKDYIPEWREKFHNGCQSKINNGEVTKEYVEKIFMELLAFQGYGFNASHSYAYSFFSAWQLYLKAHYFDEFMTVCLNAVDRTKEKKGVDLLDYRVKYALRHGVNLYPPNINISKKLWTLTDKGIVVGLSGIKTIGKDAQLIVDNQPYSSINNVLEKLSLNRNKFEALLFAGCFDEFDDRVTLYNWYHNEYKTKKVTDPNQMSFDLFLETDNSNDTQFTNSELKAKEYEMLGFSIPENILGKYGEILKQRKKIKTLSNVRKNKTKFPIVFGQVQKIYGFKSKTGKEWQKIVLGDGCHCIELLISSNAYEYKKRYFQMGAVLAVPVVIPTNDNGEIDNMDLCFLNDDKIQIEILDLP